jgi:hypothetical protein
MSWRVYPPGDSVPGYDVCPRVVSDEFTGRSAHEDPSDEDAALIAAAPELLDALARVLFAWKYDADQGDGICEEHLPVYERARAAIAKARGES